MIRGINAIVLSALIILSLASFANAGAVSGDVLVLSDTGLVANVAGGHDVTAETNVHSVDVQDGGHTGDILVLGQNDATINAGVGHNVTSEANVGGVRVGE